MCCVVTFYGKRIKSLLLLKTIIYVFAPYLLHWHYRSSCCCGMFHFLLSFYRKTMRSNPLRSQNRFLCRTSFGLPQASDGSGPAGRTAQPPLHDQCPIWVAVGLFGMALPLLSMTQVQRCLILRWQQLTASLRHRGQPSICRMQYVSHQLKTEAVKS